MRNQIIEGIVLRRANVGEADRIITLLTPSGKLACYVRGIRRITSRKAGALDFLHQVDCLIRQKENSLAVIEEVTIRLAPNALRTDLQAFQRACWITELLDHFLEDGLGGNLYQSFAEYLKRLNHTFYALESRVLELLIMEELGWQPEVHVCARCHQFLDPDKLFWSASIGGVLDSDCAVAAGERRRLTSTTVKLLRLLMREGLAVTRQLTVSEQSVKEVEQILYDYVTYHGERQWRVPMVFAQPITP